ncbi:MAG: Flp family type IVb pilin [Planctomycetota bacterium]
MFRKFLALPESVAKYFWATKCERKKVMRLIKSFLVDESGTETVEWGIMAGLIVAGLVGVVAAIGIWVKDKFDELEGGLNPGA